MPTYEFRCPAGHDFERFFRKISDGVSELPCPTCGAVAARRVSLGAGLHFKGSGFYITDYGKDGKKGQPGAKSGAESSASERGSSESGTAASGSSDRGSQERGSSEGGTSKAADSAGKSDAGKSGDSSASSGKQGGEPKPAAPAKKSSSSE